jgi:hypothetical protein
MAWPLSLAKVFLSTREIDEGQTIEPITEQRAAAGVKYARRPA